MSGCRHNLRAVTAGIMIHNLSTTAANYVLYTELILRGKKDVVLIFQGQNIEKYFKLVVLAK